MKNKSIEAKPFPKQPTLTGKIIRYVSVVHFLDLLQTESFYMSSFTHFKDKFEGASFKNLKDGRIDGENAKDSKDSMEITDRKKVLFASCWYIGNETISMWDNYGKSSSEYIAIQFELKDIIKELEKGNFRLEGKDEMRDAEEDNPGEFKPSSFFYGSINYIDKFDKKKDFLGRFKHCYFKHEKEFRFLVRRWLPSGYKKENPEITELNGVKLRFDNFKGLGLKVIISPYANSTMIEIVNSALQCKEYKQVANPSEFSIFLSE